MSSSDWENLSTMLKAGAEVSRGSTRTVLRIMSRYARQVAATYRKEEERQRRSRYPYYRQKPEEGSDV